MKTATVKAPLEMFNEILTSRGHEDEKTIAFAKMIEDPAATYDMIKTCYELIMGA
jgi:hypothetical protein